MIKFFVTAFLIGCGAMLGACATLNESECKTVDWKQLGDTDGSQGHLATRIAKHNKACEKHGLSVDAARYHSGWQAGIVRFCTPQNGFTLGARGGSYAGSCPSELASAFEAAYRPAFALYRAENDLHAIESRIDARIDEIRYLSLSHKPEDRERLRHASEDLRHLRYDLPSRRVDVEIAHRNRDDYLRANPHILAF